MKINGISNLQAYQKYSANVIKTEKKITDIPKQDCIEISDEGRKAAKAYLPEEILKIDNGEISENMEETECSGEASETCQSEEIQKDSDKYLPESKDPASETKSGGIVAFNAAKRARQLAAASTSDQVQIVMDLLDQDLSDCKEGLSKGMCDEDEVAAVEAMIRRAKQRMSQVSGEENQENDSNSDLAFAIASLM